MQTTNQLYQAAVQAQQQGNADAAFDHYLALLRQQPTHREALLAATRLGAPMGRARALCERVAALVVESPWDFEAIDVLIECDPGLLCRSAHVVMGARAVATSVPAPAPVTSWLPLAHSRDRWLVTAMLQHSLVDADWLEAARQLEDDALQREHLMTMRRVSSQQSFGPLWDLYQLAGQRVGIDLPDLFVDLGKQEVNAYATGITRPIICLNAGLLERLDSDEEMLFVLGHEMGHLLHKHGLVRRLTDQIVKEYAKHATAAQKIKTHVQGSNSLLGKVTVAVADGFTRLREEQARALLVHATLWTQFREFSADRVGLAACRSLKGATNALVKIEELDRASASLGRYGTATFNLEAYLQAWDEAARDFMHIRPLEELARSHPFTAYRIRALQAWTLSDGYRFLFGVN